eukprot:TRINITY_DN1051_c0_g2_i1.p1 TRINITY_DN1051_c0_g2~~TRINITY_DN1051_c0_g2_i1.p1  ORF type:complete len:496 (-),score=97.42 TRINITY_DN1051_c0_g2_i1:486-1973(-)
MYTYNAAATVPGGSFAHNFYASPPTGHTQTRVLTNRTSASMSRISSVRLTEDDTPAYLVLKPDLRTVLSPFRRVLIPETPISEFFLELIEPHHEQLALVDCVTGHKVTYRQLSSAIRKVASQLFVRNLRQGDVVGIMAPNLPEYPLIAHATCLYGGVISPVNPAWSDEEIAQQISMMRIRHVFVAPAFVPRMQQIWDRLNAEPHALSRDHANIFVIGQVAPGSNHTPFADLLRGETLFPDQTIDPHDQVAAVFFTKDNTGAIKGMEFTHYSLTAALVQALAYDDINPADRLFASIPFYTPIGFNIQLNVALARGATVVTQFRPSKASLDAILTQYQITRIYVDSVTSLREIALLRFADAALNCVVFASSSTALSAAARELESALPVNLRVLYGMDECITTHAILKGSAVDTVGGSGAPVGSIGQLLPNVECLVRQSKTGTPMAANEVGDIYVRAPQCFAGYAPGISSTNMDAQGWIYTGLKGSYDRKGYFYIKNA